MLTCCCQIQLLAHQKEFISVDSSGASLGDTIACHLNETAALAADGAQSQRDDPESRGNFLSIRLSGLVIHCPTEWVSARENSSCPGTLGFSEHKGSSKQPMFRLISFPALASAVWKDSEETPHHPLFHRPWRGLASQVNVNLFGKSVMEGGPEGPLGGKQVHAHLRVESAFSGSSLWMRRRSSGKSQDGQSEGRLGSVQQGSWGAGSQLRIRNWFQGSRGDHWTIHPIRRQHVQNPGLFPHILLCQL